MVGSDADWRDQYDTGRVGEKAALQRSRLRNQIGYVDLLARSVSTTRIDDSLTEIIFPKPTVPLGIRL